MQKERHNKNLEKKYSHEKFAHSPKSDVAMVTASVRALQSTCDW